MTLLRITTVLAALAASPAAIAATPAAAPAPVPVASLRGMRRVLLVSAPGPADPALRTQDRALAGWRDAAADRDVTVVHLTGDAVSGAGDRAAALRDRYALPADRFALVLLGKDGHVALRAAHPVAAAALAATIDAMPMRRAGLR